MRWVRSRLHLYHFVVIQPGDDMQMDGIRHHDVQGLRCNQDLEAVLLECVALRAFCVCSEQVLAEQNVQNEYVQSVNIW